MTREYTVSDLFYDRWEQLSAMIHAEVYALQQLARQENRESIEYGLRVIGVLRQLRKNKTLVDKINEAQAVDIYNDLKFLDEPWTYFPVKVLPTRIGLLYAPEDKLATHTFDHFIYADNEFTSFLATQDRKYLVRLAATLYRAKGEVYLDKELVDERAKLIEPKLKPWQEALIFATYGHIREFITRRCKTLLPAPIKSESTEPMKVVPTGPMWLKLKHRLSETPAFQGYETAGRANVYAALDYLEDLSQIKERK